jgi:DNA-binding response OmpR family regulator
MANGFTSAERRGGEAMLFLRHLQPGLVVAVVDPLLHDDMALIELLARPGPYLLVVSPTRDSHPAALHAGADACLCDTDSDETLDAQLAAIRRRLPIQGQGDAPESTLSIAGFTIDAGARSLSRDDKTIQLTAIEFSLVSSLVQNAGRVMSPVELLRNATGRIERERDASQMIKVHIGHIRKKLDQQASEPHLIATIRGSGYMYQGAGRSPRK